MIYFFYEIHVSDNVQVVHPHNRKHDHVILERSKEPCHMNSLSCDTKVILPLSP